MCLPEPDGPRRISMLWWKLSCTHVPHLLLKLSDEVFHVVARVLLAPEHPFCARDSNCGLLRQLEGG